MAKHNLEFTNRWMFNRVVCQEGVCRGLIRALLGIEVGSITYLNAEQPYEPGAESRGVRMDVVAKEDGRMYDIEMQVGPETQIGRRMRYYQAAMDVGELAPGGAWGLLPESHIVFVCSDDLFGRGLPVYTIDRLCREIVDLDIDDDSHWHVLNASAWESVRDIEASEVLHYVHCGDATGPLTKEIDGLVARYNEDRRWVGRVMLWETDTMIRCQQAKEQGEERFALLAKRLIAEGRATDVTRAADDRSFRDQLFKEFEIE